MLKLILNVEAKVKTLSKPMPYGNAKRPKDFDEQTFVPLMKRLLTNLFQQDNA